MTQPELIQQLYQRLATTSDEAPYCIIPRSLLTAAINAIDHIVPVTTDPVLIAIEHTASPKEFRILCRLAQGRGGPVTHAAIMEAANIATINSLQVNISRLRAKLAKHGWSTIVPIPGTGYVWIRHEMELPKEHQ